METIMPRKLDTNNLDELVLLIKQEIIKRNLSSKSVALGAGVSPSYLSEVLTGKKQPSLTIVSDLAEYLGIPWSQFLQLSGRIGNEEEVLLIQIEETIKEDPMLKNILAEILNLDDDKRQKALDAFSKALSEIK
jgi:transcriptional regulator with XRE-family HTH domain